MWHLLPSAPLSTAAPPGWRSAPAVKQEVARRNRWPLDAVVLSSDVTRFADEGAVKSAPDEGVYVCGLFLDGAAWSAREQRLVDSEPKVGARRAGLGRAERA